VAFPLSGLSLQPVETVAPADVSAARMAAELWFLTEIRTVPVLVLSHK